MFVFIKFFFFSFRLFGYQLEIIQFIKRLSYVSVYNIIYSILCRDSSCAIFNPINVYKPLCYCHGW